MFKQPSKLALLVLGIALSTACTRNTVSVDAPIADVANWHLTGKLAVIQPEQRLSANVNWHHQSSLGEDQLRLSTPIGITILEMDSEPNYARIELDGKIYEGRSSDQLIEALTGWPLPLSQISRYLLGNTEQAESVQYATDGNLASLTLIHPQTGQNWQLHYLGWQLRSGYKVPTQIELRQGEQRLKLALSDWQPEL